MFDYTARPDLLKDRVILVTGAGRGIGVAGGGKQLGACDELTHQTGYA